VAVAAFQLGPIWGGTNEAEAVATIQSAIAAGITLIDTAPVYGFGRSEQILGRALEIRNLDPKFGPTAYGSYLRAVERLDALARQRFGKRVLRLALRWLLDQPGVAVAFWGAPQPKTARAFNADAGVAPR
jgi:aryl-alcohol dehydrogenase-like predicted oxidoreductase